MEYQKQISKLPKLIKIFAQIFRMNNNNAMKENSCKKQRNKRQITKREKESCKRFTINSISMKLYEIVFIFELLRQIHRVKRKA